MVTTPTPTPTAADWTSVAPRRPLGTASSSRPTPPREAPARGPPPLVPESCPRPLRATSSSTPPPLSTAPSGSAVLNPSSPRCPPPSSAMPNHLTPLTPSRPQTPLLTTASFRESPLPPRSSTRARRTPLPPPPRYPSPTTMPPSRDRNSTIVRARLLQARSSTRLAASPMRSEPF